jgi:tRNA pseudouridine38-40 synthase
LRKLNRNLKFTIAYNGANYRGFQYNPNLPTIEGSLLSALRKYFKEPAITGCSRTDSGVHAEKYIFNMFTDNPIPTENIIYAMNNVLPGDIAVLDVREADADFHARHSCTGKKYVYILRQDKQRDVFQNKLYLHYPHIIRVAELKKAAGLFAGEHDFRGFCKAESVKLHRTTVRKIFFCNVTGDNQTTEISVAGTGFLHNMVRIIAGTLLDLNEGKITAEEIKLAIEKGERSMAGRTVPACGLYLKEVYYD